MGVSKHPRTMALPWGSLARRAGTVTRGACHVQWRVRPSSVWKAANTTNKENKNNTSEKGTKRPADKRPKRASRASPKNPETPWGQETNPENTRRMHGQNGRETTATKGTKKKNEPTKRNVQGGACDLLAWAVSFQLEEEKKEREHNKTNANNGDDET